MIARKKEDFLVPQEQKLGPRGHQALLEHSLAVSIRGKQLIKASITEYHRQSSQVDAHYQTLL